MKVTESQLINNLCYVMQNLSPKKISKKDIADICGLWSHLIQKALLEGDSVCITNLGTFSSKLAKSKTVPDPQDRTQIIQLKERYLPKFKFATELRRGVRAIEIKKDDSSRELNSISSL